MQFISRQHGQPELYEGLISDLDPLAMPYGASELEVKMRQVCVETCCELCYDSKLLLYVIIV